MPYKKKTKKSKAVEFVSVDNAADLASALGLGVEVAAEWEFREDLLEKIISILAKTKLTHQDIADRVGSSRTRITAILNHRIHDVSTDLLIRVLRAVGYRLQVQVKKIA